MFNDAELRAAMIEDMAEHVIVASVPKYDWAAIEKAKNEQEVV